MSEENMNLTVSLIKILLTRLSERVVNIDNSIIKLVILECDYHAV